MGEVIHGMMQFLTHDSEPPELKDWLRPVSMLAAHIATGPMNLETLAAMRKLIECKDCMRRAVTMKPMSK
jgi:hypothetical protein